MELIKRYHVFIAIILFFFLGVSIIGSAKVNAKANKVRVEGIRSWSTPTYTRVVIDLTGSTSYKYRLLKPDPSIKKPRRLFIDISNTIRPSKIKGTIPINDGLLKRVRVGQNDKKTVRVVLDMESIKDYKVFSLENPFRIVIDVTGGKKLDRKTGEAGGPSIVQQLGLKVGRIIIDPGHGGKDPGAMGKRGLKEKDINLKIAKKLERLLKKRFKGEVILTRRNDRFIRLDERTAIANTRKADLFLSIHVNASPNKKVRGVETYYLNYTTDKDTIRIAARENAISTKNISDLQFILNDLINTAKSNESIRFAANVQESLVATLKSRYKDVNGNGVKGAPFYVLVRAQMPSILVEVSYISNSRDEARLKKNAYLDQVARGIAKGVMQYVKDNNMGISEL